jgi:hypothetical protein
VGCSGVEVDASFENHLFIVFFLSFFFLHMKKGITYMADENRNTKEVYMKHLSFLCSI